MSALDDLKVKPAEDLTLPEMAILFIHDPQKYDAGYIDTYQAASELASLRAENAELRSALEEIIAECPNPDLSYGKRVVEIARDGLKKAEEKGNP